MRSSDDVFAIRQRANDVNMWQAQAITYDGLHAWRKHVGHASMRIAASASSNGTFVRGDYVVVPARLLHTWADEKALAVTCDLGVFAVRLAEK